MMFILNNVCFYYIAARYFAALLNIGNFVNKLKVGSFHSFLCWEVGVKATFVGQTKRDCSGVHAPI